MSELFLLKIGVKNNNSPNICEDELEVSSCAVTYTELNPRKDMLIDNSVNERIQRIRVFSFGIYIYI